MFYDTFESLCWKGRTSPSSVCKELGLSVSVASYWKRSGCVPKHDTLEKIAKYFGVSVDYLLGRETDEAQAQSTSVGSKLSEEDTEILSLYHKMSERSRMQELGRWRLLVEMEK